MVLTPTPTAVPDVEELVAERTQVLERTIREMQAQIAALREEQRALSATPPSKISEAEGIASLRTYFSDQSTDFFDELKNMAKEHADAGCDSPANKSLPYCMRIEREFPAFSDEMDTWFELWQAHPMAGDYQGEGAWLISVTVRPAEGSPRVEHWWVFESGETSPTRAR